MTFDEAVHYFGSQTALAKAMGCSAPFVTEIKQKGEIPENWQWKLEGITNGVLRADDKYRPTEPTAA